VYQSNKKVFEREKEHRNSLRRQASAVLMTLDSGNIDSLRSKVTWMAGKSNDDIRNMANRLIKLADSPHPLQGFWDSHGRIVDNNE
jgi:hypothetical protein